MSTRSPRSTAIRAISGVSIAVLALAGCSDSEEPSTDEGTSTSASADQGDSSESAGNESDDADSGDSGGASAGAFDKEAAKGVLLTAEEIGSGYSAIPEAQISDAMSQAAGPLTQALESMQVEPAVCEAVMKTSVGQMGDLAEKIDQMAMGIYMKGTDVASESIAPASVLPAGDIGAQADACSEMTLTIMGVTAEASMTPVDLDLGDETTAYITEISMNAGGQSVNQVSAQATVVQGESALSISLSGADATEQTLTDVTTKAFEKAEPVLG